MKVAVVLTGHLRCWGMVFPSFQSAIINRYNPDIFIHTWTDEGYWVPHEGKLGIKEHTPLIDEAAVREHYKPVDMAVEEFMPLEPVFAERVKAFTNYYHRPRNIVSMFYKMGAGMQMVEQHAMKTGAKYDMVIRMRPDMILHSPMPEFEEGVFYTLAHRNHMQGGTGDMFQIGGMDDVLKFSKIGMHMESLYEQTGLLCPHVFSEAYIKNLSLNWREFNIHKTIQHTPNGPYRAC